MGTRSFIILPNPKGDYTGIYCHWDGYPKHVGRLLRDHYSKPAAARELIRLGDLSSLGERLRPLNPEAHSFDEAERGTTVAYGRDRGEPSPPRTTATLAEMVQTAADSWCEYVYLLFNGVWHVLPIDEALDRQPFHTVDAALRSQTEEA